MSSQTIEIEGRETVIVGATTAYLDLPKAAQAILNVADVDRLSLTLTNKVGSAGAISAVAIEWSDNAAHNRPVADAGAVLPGAALAAGSGAVFSWADVCHKTLRVAVTTTGNVTVQVDLFAKGRRS